MFARVYLDHNAATPVLPAVLEAMLPYFGRGFGNPSSRHDFGRAARRAVDEARQQVALATGAHPTEVVFTGGGSESNNLFLKGASAGLKPALAAVSAVEHPSVREPARDLVRLGWSLREIGVDAQGRVQAADYARAIEQRPALLSIMLANNETGVLQDLGPMAEAARPVGALFHTDAVQALGKIALDFRSLNAQGVHAMTVSAHKIGGPKGTGALVLDKRVDLRPLISGGGHERGLRSGTENVPAIVGFGVACQLAVAGLAETASRLGRLRDELEGRLAGCGATIFGGDAKRLPNTVYFSLPGIDGETLVSKLDRAGFAVASGAACASASPEASHVLTAMGVAPELARGAVRVSLGAATVASEVADFTVALVETASQLRRLVSLAA